MKMVDRQVKFQERNGFQWMDEENATVCFLDNLNEASVILFNLF